MNSTSSPHDWKEARRFRALALKQEGWAHQEMAAALGVTKGAVSHWITTIETVGLGDRRGEDLESFSLLTRVACGTLQLRSG